jgi:hypothetical protein
MKADELYFYNQRGDKSKLGCRKSRFSRGLYNGKRHYPLSRQQERVAIVARRTEGGQLTQKEGARSDAQESGAQNRDAAEIESTSI